MGGGGGGGLEIKCLISIHTLHQVVIMAGHITAHGVSKSQNKF